MLKNAGKTAKHVQFALRNSSIDNGLEVSKCINRLENGVEIYKIEGSGKQVPRIILVDPHNCQLEFHSQKNHFFGSINISSFKSLETFWLDDGETLRRRSGIQFMFWGIEISYDEYKLKIMAQNNADNDVILISLRFLMSADVRSENEQERQIYSKLGEKTFLRSDLLFFMNRNCSKFNKFNKSELLNIVPTFTISPTKKKASNEGSSTVDFDEFEQIAINDNLCCINRPNWMESVRHDIDNYFFYSVKNGHLFRSNLSPLNSFKELLLDGCRSLDLNILFSSNGDIFLALNDRISDYSSGNDILLSKFLTMLSKIAFIQSKFPMFLFLFFDNEVSSTQFNKLYKLLRCHIGPKIYIPNKTKLPFPELIYKNFILFTNTKNDKIKGSNISKILIPVYTSESADDQNSFCLAVEYNYKDIFKPTKLKINENKTFFFILRLNESENPMKAVMEAWKRGIQFVIWDFKIMGTCEHYSHSFQGNGFMLKPAEIQSKLSFGPFSSSYKKPQSQKILLTIISARDLPIEQFDNQISNTIDPYCVIELNEFHKDKSMSSTRVKSNTNNPNFMESFTCYIDCSDFAQLRLAIYDADYIKKSFIGDTIIPIRFLRSGLQWLPIFDSSGKKIENSRIYLSAKIEVISQKNDKLKKIVQKIRKANTISEFSTTLIPKEPPQETVEDLIVILKEFSKEITSPSSLCANCISSSVDLIDLLIDCFTVVEPVKFNIKSDLNHKEKCSDAVCFFDKFAEKYSAYSKSSSTRTILKPIKNTPNLRKRFSFRNTNKRISTKMLEADQRNVLNNELKYMRYWFLTIEEINN